MKTRDREKESREAIVLMLLILLLGVLCIILTSGWALRFRSSWQLPANMDSNLNPNSDIQTGVPVDLFEPLDPSILTNPAWIDVFLTPGASFATRPPLPTSTRSPSPTNVTIATNTGLPVITSSPTNTPLPTNTVIFIPPFTATPRPPRPPRDTPTASPMPVSADLAITKDDGVTTYVSGGTLTYTIVVSNNGPDNVSNAAVTDNFPAQVASATWTCVGASGATCTASGSGNISDPVNLPAGSSLTYTVNVTISTGVTGDLTNTATVSSAIADPATGNNSSTDTDTQFILADLAITKTDLVTTYVPGGTLTYFITVTNNGPDNISNATVTDIFPPTHIASATWTCAVVTGSATCTVSGTGDISDSVDLPAGSSIQYTVDVTILPGATGDLTNEAIVGFSADDPVPGNNTATDTDTP
jgi:uncharacterized repeat protein (TIGR01451 family)